MKISISYILPFIAGSLMLFSCAPVLDRSFMREGDRQASFAALRENADAYKGRLFIFGGVIVRTKFIEEGSQIEALHVPVDSYGYFKDSGRSEGRFLALAPRDGKMTDPVVYRQGRRVTLAAELIGTRKGKIDEIEYLYPVFQIKQVYLWPEERPYYYYPPYFYDPWFYPYPYYYRHAWWRYPHRYYPVPVQPPVYRRTPAPAQPLPSSPPPTRQPRREQEHERDREIERR